MTNNQLTPTPLRFDRGRRFNGFFSNLVLFNMYLILPKPYERMAMNKLKSPSMAQTQNKQHPHTDIQICSTYIYINSQGTHSRILGLS